MFLDVPGFEAACLVVHAAGAPAGTIAWQPYEAELAVDAGELALEVVLTRRNTFGPLHETPLRACTLTSPDAVVATNNLMGVGALQILNEHRLAPPKIGVAVVGSLPFTTMSPRDVTVVRLPARHMGITAARLLLERIDGDTQPSRTIVLRHVLEPAIETPSS